MSIRVLTYNVRYAALDGGDDAWAERRDGVASVLRFHDPDVVCLQEVWEDQLSDLQGRLPGYAWVCADTSSGEHTPIGYRTDRFAVTDSDAFSLSETPADLHAMDWETTVPRVTTTARLAGDGHAELLVANAHLDHDSEPARRRGAELLADRFGDRAGDTVLAADLNSGPADPPYRTLTGDGGFRAARSLADHPHGPRTTFNDFEAPQPGERLDYVLVDGAAVGVDRFGVLAELDDRCRYPSDHFPVRADLTLRE